VRSFRVGRQPHDAVAARGRFFVGDELGSTLSVLAPGAARRTVRVAVQPGGVAAAEGGRAIAVVSVRENVVELYDARDLRRTGRATAGRGPSHVVSDGGGQLWVADTRGGAILAYRVRPRLTLTGRVPVPGSPYGLAYDARRHAVWVTATGRNALVEVSATARPRVLRTFATVRQADSVAVDPATGRVYVAGWRAGVLELLNPRPRG
jgi:DNA-binding beta-propeller fold protein YncE